MLKIEKCKSFNGEKKFSSYWLNMNVVVVWGNKGDQKYFGGC